MGALPSRSLGASGIEVSTLALGSWRTYERISREHGVAVMHAARECGMTFLDDARYNDETGTAPIPTGYSEVVFGELFRAAGWKRDEVVVANKLWWEFWPEQSAAAEVDASLARMGFDYIDVVYSWLPQDDLSVEEIVGSVGGLIQSGKVRAWGTGNWVPADHAAAAEIARAEGVPPPCAAQLPYSLALRTHVEGSDAIEALDASGAAVVASYVLYGGVLTGKYSGGSASGRDDGRARRPGLAACSRSRPLAGRARGKAGDELGSARARVRSGQSARRDRALRRDPPEQVTENVRAVELLEQLEPAALAELQAIT